MAEQTLRDTLALRGVDSPVDGSVTLRRVGTPVDPSSSIAGTEPEATEAGTEPRYRRFINRFYKGKADSGDQQNSRSNMREVVDLVVFYFFFYTANVAYWCALVAFYYSTLSHFKPYVTGRDTILSSPGLTLRPLNPEAEGTAVEVDWLPSGHFDPLEDIRRTLKTMRGPWFDVNQDIVTGGCGPCSHLTGFGTLATVDGENHVTAPKPCILLKLNRIYGFKPKGTTVNVTTPGDEGRDFTGETGTIQVAKVSCKIDGQEQGISYFPQQGFALHEFPFEETRKSPFVFLQFTNIVNQGKKTVTCEMLDENIAVEVGSSPGESLGYTTFSVKFDWTPSTPSTKTVPCNKSITVQQPTLAPTTPAGSRCYHGESTDYLGDVNTTMTHRQCQLWTSRTPHIPRPDLADLWNNTYGTEVPDHNKCRNPDNEPKGPWCYTTDKQKRWEYCMTEQCACKSGYTFGGGFCYRLENDRRTWHEALSECVLQGGTLAQPKTQAENNAIVEVIGNVGLTWVGGNKTAAGQWQWMNGVEVDLGSFLNWGPGEPHGGKGEDCMCINDFGQGKWHDCVCRKQLLPSVCQIKTTH